jgi:hypothetical protein
VEAIVDRHIKGRRLNIFLPTHRQQNKKTALAQCCFCRASSLTGFIATGTGINFVVLVMLDSDAHENLAQLIETGRLIRFNIFQRPFVTRRL